MNPTATINQNAPHAKCGNPKCTCVKCNCVQHAIALIVNKHYQSNQHQAVPQLAGLFSSAR